MACRESIVHWKYEHPTRHFVQVRVFGAANKQACRAAQTAMGYAYSGEAGLIAGFSWATLCNWQQALPWFRRPWYHAGGMIAGYTIFKLASAYEDAQLKNLIMTYERKGYVIPEDRKKLFEPTQYK